MIRCFRCGGPTSEVSTPLLRQWGKKAINVCDDEVCRATVKTEARAARRAAEAELPELERLRVKVKRYDATLQRLADLTDVFLRGLEHPPLDQKSIKFLANISRTLGKSK